MKRVVIVCSRPACSHGPGRHIAGGGCMDCALMQRAHARDLLRHRHVEALRLTKHREPWHPLYVRGNVAPISYWEPRPC